MEHIQQARNRNYEIMIIGDFNVNPDKPRYNETKYKRQFEIIQYLRNLFFFDIFDTIYDITEQNPYNTWFNNSKQLASRIDFVWLSENTIDHLVYCDSFFTELYTSDHKLLICFMDKSSLFGDSTRSKLRNAQIKKTIFHYDKMNKDL